MKRALISDIHGNLEALEAVLEDIRQVSVDEIYCLGDIIGYGPNPCECLDLVIKNCKSTILGNHDQAALFDPDGFNPMALQAIYWTRDQLDNGPGSAATVKAYFLAIAASLDEGMFRFVHDHHATRPTNTCSPSTCLIRGKWKFCLARCKTTASWGTTCWSVYPECEFISPDECDYSYQLGEKVLVNVGSVGQPQDDDNQTCLRSLTRRPRRCNTAAWSTISIKPPTKSIPLLIFPTRWVTV